MAWVERRVTRTSQPQELCGIDWSNPLTTGLILADATPQRGGAPNLAEPAYAEFISNNPINTVGVPGVGLKTLNVSDYKSYGLVGQIAPPLTLMALYRVYTTDTSRNVGNLSASNYGYGLANSTAYRGILSRSGANTILTGTTVVAGKLKLDILIAKETTGEFWENGIRTAGPTSHGGVAQATGAFRIAADNSGGTSGANQDVFATALWNRALSDAEIKSLSDNPWQIFEPEVTRIWVEDYVSAGGGATVIPIGVQATGSVGTPSVTGAANATPSGVSTTASVGTPVAVGGASIPATALPAGIAASSAVGTPVATGAAVALPAGVSASSAVGVPVAIAGTSIPATVLPTGVQAFGAVGTPTVTAAAIAQPLGVAAIAYVGTPTIATGVSGVAVAYPAGVQAIGQVGTLIATGAAWTAAFGVQAVASVGTPSAYAGIQVIYTPGAQTRPSRLQSSSRPSRLQTGTRASR